MQRNSVFMRSGPTPELTGRGKKHSAYEQSFDDEKHSIRAPVE
jgi:hypothetical protein